MDDFESPPRVFGNHVIKQMVEHMLAGDMDLDFDDFQIIRIAFRSLGGSWGGIALGDIVNLELLKKVVLAWGEASDKGDEAERVV